MRNLKRALSLGMTAAMISGLVVTSGAASFPDVTSKDNVEAIEVLKAVGVMAGDENGKFNPNQNVTRAEMAVVMCNMLGLRVNDYENAVIPFTDVPQWAHKYVAACYAEGITGGTSATTYSSNAGVTTAQAALMLMKALGYFQYNGDFGSDWQLATVNQASKIDLFDGIDASATAALTRNEVAQMALNTLEATMVEPTGSEGVQIGDITVGSTIKYEDLMKGDSAKYTTIGNEAAVNGKYAVQLGEELFDGKLTKQGGDTEDSFGRPGFTWTYDNKEVCFVADEAAVTYTKALDSSKSSQVTDAKKALTNAGVKVNSGTTTLTTAVATGANWKNGSANQGGLTTVENVMDLTGNGKKVEIFVDDETDAIEAVVVTEYTVAEVTDITTGKKESNGSVYTQYTLENVGNNATTNYKVYTDAKNDEEDTIVVYDGIVKGDIVTYTTDGTDTYAYATTKVLGTQTAIKSDVITVSGKQYTIGTGVQDGSAAVATTTFTNTDEDNYYYIDQYGYAVYTSAVSAPTQYAIVDKIVKEGGLNSEVSAQLIFADGTTKTVTIDAIDTQASTTDVLSTVTTNVDAAANTAFAGIVYTYVINDDGNYELTAVPNGTNSAAAATNVVDPTTKGNPIVTANGGNITTDNKTVFVVKTLSDGKDKFTAYTGYQNMPTIVDSAATVDYAKKDGRVEIVYIDATSATSVTDASSDSTMVYIVDKDTYVVKGVSGKETYTYDAIVDGKASTVTVKGTAQTTIQSNGDGLYMVTTVNSDDVVTAVVAQSTGSATNDEYKKIAVANITSDAKNGVLVTSVGTYTYNDKTVAYFISADGSVSTGSVDGVKADSNVTVELYVKLVSGTTTNEIDTIYVVLK